MISARIYRLVTSLKWLGLLVGLLAPILVVQAQVQGIVVDSLTGAPLGKASIVGKAKSGTSDARGQFRLEKTSIGETITVSYVGYQKRVITITGHELLVKLLPNESRLDEVMVHGLSPEAESARQVKNNVMPVTVLTARDIENRASNLNELLTRQTGVQIRRTGGLGSEARISVRGLEGKRVQIFLDGNPLNTPDGSLGINDLPLQIIERIEIYKGTIPAWLGGDGLGSAVSVVFRHREVSYVDATASYQSFNTLNTGLILKKSFDKAGIEVGGGVFTNSSDNNYIMELPTQPGVRVRRDHDKFRSLLVGGSVRFHKLWFDEIELEGAMVSLHKQLQGVVQNIQHIQTDGTTTAFVLSLKKTLFNNRLFFKYSGIRAHINVQFTDTSSYSYDWEGNRFPSIYSKGELGIGPNLSTNIQHEFRQQANLNYKLTPTVTLNLNNTLRKGNFQPTDDLANKYAGRDLFNYPGSVFNSITGLTVENRIRDEKLLVSAALKHYYTRVTGYNTNIYLQTPPDPVLNLTNTLGYNAGIRYNFTPALLVKGSYERAVRLPQNSELFGDGALITPSILLKPERADNYTVGIIYDKFNPRQNRLQVDGNVFYMRVDNLIQLAGAGGFTTGYVNFAKVDIMGGDAEIKADLTPQFFVNTNITWQRLRDINQFLPGTQNVANPTYGLQIPYVPELFSNLTLEYHKENLLTQNAKTRLLYEGSFVNRYNYSFNLSQYDGYFIPAYVSHNLVLEQSFQNQRYVITAEAQNLTNARIINNWNMPLPGRTFRVKLRYLLLGKPDAHAHH